MKPDHVVYVDIVSQNTAHVRGSRISYMLQQAGVLRQYNAAQGCWMTALSTLPDLLAWLQDRKRPVVVREVLL